MGKSSKRYKKETFSQKKREMYEIEDLDRSGYSDMISNNKIIKVIRGFFKNQHDVDIIDDRRI